MFNHDCSHVFFEVSFAISSEDIKINDIEMLQDSCRTVVLQ
ncbi:TPA: hypothetical protein ACTLIK_001703 [Legionella pneumophila]